MLYTIGGESGSGGGIVPEDAAADPSVGGKYISPPLPFRAM